MKKITLNSEPSFEFYNSIFIYSNGKIYWKINISGRMRPDREAGTLCFDKNRPLLNRWKVQIARKWHRRANIVWIMHFGCIPEKMEVDHINRNSTDDRIENLRLATRSQNNVNRKTNSNNTSGYRGVSWSKDRRKWNAQIFINSKRINLGFFDSVLDASECYNKKRSELFGDFAN